MSQGQRCGALSALIIVALFTQFIAVGEAEVWGVKSHDPVSDPPATLFHFTTAGGPLVVIATVTLDGAAIDVDALAMDAAQTLYGFEVSLGDARSRLITIDKTNAIATAEGPYLPARDMRGAVITSGGGLLAADATANALLCVDPQTGLVVGPGIALSLDGQPFDVSNASDIAETGDGVLILSNLNRFYSVDPATGQLTLLYVDNDPGPDGTGLANAGLAWEPTEGGDYPLATYDIQLQDDIFCYQPSAGFARDVLYADIIPSFNAGRGDLAAPPEMVSSIPDQGPPGLGSLYIRACPYPSVSQASVTFSLPGAARVRIAIYDVAGRCLRTLQSDGSAAGERVVLWDGRDDRGCALPTGSYLCRLQADGLTTTTRVLLVR
jgi:hypothetical protein